MYKGEAYVAVPPLSLQEQEVLLPSLVGLVVNTFFLWIVFPPRGLCFRNPVPNPYVAVDFHGEVDFIGGMDV